MVNFCKNYNCKKEIKNMEEAFIFKDHAFCSWTCRKVAYEKAFKQTSN